MIGLGKWQAEINNIIFKGSAVFTIADNNGEYKISLELPGEDLGVTDTNNMGAAMAPDDVKIRPYPTHEGMVFFYTQIQYLRGLRALFKNFQSTKIRKKQWT